MQGRTKCICNTLELSLSSSRFFQSSTSASVYCRTQIHSTQNVRPSWPQLCQSSRFVNQGCKQCTCNIRAEFLSLQLFYRNSTFESVHCRTQIHSSEIGHRPWPQLCPHSRSENQHNKLCTGNIRAEFLFL